MLPSINSKSKVSTPYLSLKIVSYHKALKMLVSVNFSLLIFLYLSIGVSCDDTAYVINKLNSFGQLAYSKPDIVYAQGLGNDESDRQ